VVLTIPPPPGRDTRARRLARARLARTIWDDDGARRLPLERDLVLALEACTPHDVWWTCEASPAGPVYLLPTREWVRALARTIRSLGARSVVEVAAGDGFLSDCLRPRLPDVRVIATDSGKWSRPGARMSPADRRAFRGVPFAGIRAGPDVRRMAASGAIARFRPDLVIVSWAPPGLLVERAIRAPCRFVLDLSVHGDVCGSAERTWRFRKEFLEGPVARALTRLDARPHERRATVATLYYGRLHPFHGLE
jgi:hypothetical protein